MVRASVVNDGCTLATGLAASVDVQIAEDKARERAIALLGIMPRPPKPTSEPSPQPHAELAESSTPSEVTSTLPSEVSAAVPDNVSMPSASMPTEVAAKKEAGELEEDLGPPIDVIEERAAEENTAFLDESLEPVASNKVSAATIALENFSASANPVDLSDVIAQTDVELTRLGWTSAQGREYLEQTYGKRSRQQLTDEELMSFLLYLEDQ